MPHACPGPSQLIQFHIITGVAFMFQVTPTTHSHSALSASADLSHAYSHLSEPNISILALWTTAASSGSPIDHLVWVTWNMSATPALISNCMSWEGPGHACGIEAKMHPNIYCGFVGASFKESIDIAYNFVTKWYFGMTISLNMQGRGLYLTQSPLF